MEYPTYEFPKEPLPLSDDCTQEIFTKLFEVYPVLSRILYQLYLDLKVVKNWKEFKIKEAPSESLCYLIGKKDPKSKEEIVIPVNVNAPFKVSKLDQLFKELSALEGRAVENFVMGIMSSDTSLTYYKIHSSLVPPKE